MLCWVCHRVAPSTVRPLARDLRVLIGWPFPLGFGLDGRLLLARRGRVYVKFIIISSVCHRQGDGLLAGERGLGNGAGRSWLYLSLPYSGGWALTSRIFFQPRMP